MSTVETSEPKPASNVSPQALQSVLAGHSNWATMEALGFDYIVAAIRDAERYRVVRANIGILLVADLPPHKLDILADDVVATNVSRAVRADMEREAVQARLV